MEWNIELPINSGKTSVLLFVEINGAVVYQTSFGLIRPASVSRDREFSGANI
jgi:hypothetical protein